MELYEKIIYLRKLNGFSQQDLADKINISRQSIYKWEQGLNNPDISKLNEIAKLFNITTDLLLDDNINEKDLQDYILNKSSQKTSKENINKRTRSMLDYLILVPALLGLFILIFMFYCFGFMLVGFLYIFFLSSIIAPFYGFIMIFANLSNGIGSVIVCCSIIIGGIGLIYPTFIASRMWHKKYIYLASLLTKKIKNTNWREVF